LLVNRQVKSALVLRISPYSVIVSGSESERIGTSLEFATGKELKELQAEEAGNILFSKDPIRGAFGTKENPAVIPSGHHERIVGCVGPSDNEHFPLYFLLTDGPMQKCLECGQIFKLKHVDIKGYDEEH
jgi:cytochrome c oxidase subunit 5b